MMSSIFLRISRCLSARSLKFSYNPSSRSVFTACITFLEGEVATWQANASLSLAIGPTNARPKGALMGNSNSGEIYSAGRATLWSYSNRFPVSDKAPRDISSFKFDLRTAKFPPRSDKKSIDVHHIEVAHLRWRGVCKVVRDRVCRRNKIIRTRIPVDWATIFVTSQKFNHIALYCFANGLL